MKPLLFTVKLCLGSVLLLSFLPSQAQTSSKIYKTVDENGNVSFSDQPSAQSSEVEISTPNIAQAAQPRPAKQADNTAPEQGYQSLEITRPSNETMIPNGLVPLNVLAKISPSLQPGHQLQLTINGSVHSTSSNGNFRVESLQRGQHKLQVTVIDDSGQPLKTSAIVSVFARRPGA